VERNYGLDQDWLVRDLRFARIPVLAEANWFLLL
jgi:hypothetical protein